MTEQDDSIREDEYEAPVETRDDRPEAPAEDREWDDEDVEDAFLKTLAPEGEKPAEAPKEDAEAPAADDATPAVALAADDHLVEVKVGDDVHRVPVSDLKRLFGQEAALTHKSQEVAKARDEARVEAERAKGIVSKALEKAEARFAPFAKMDFWSLSKTMDDASFAELRKMAQEAHEEVEFFRGEATAAHETVAKVNTQAHREQAQAAVAAITDPKSPHHIEGWSDKLYSDLMTFAEAQGLKTARQLVDPAAVKMISMAMAYERGRTLAETKLQNVAQQPKAPMRPAAASTRSPQDRRGDEALTRLRRTGSTEDAEAAFMARMRPVD